MSAITRQEEQLLWKGFAVWQEEIEGGQTEDGKSQNKPGRRATAGDKRAFQDFADDVNSRTYE